MERQARHVDLPAIEILEIKFPVVKFRVECSKGTYIRSLCADIGEKLCCGGTMQSLVRTRVGEFRLVDALTLAQLQELRDKERLEEALLPTDRIFSDFPMLHVEKKWRKLIDNGNAFIRDRLWNRPHIRQESGCASTERMTASWAFMRMMKRRNGTSP